MIRHRNGAEVQHHRIHLVEEVDHLALLGTGTLADGGSRTCV